MKINISAMSIKDLDLISDVLTSEFDDFWTYKILKEELQSPISRYVVAKIENTNTIVGFAGLKILVDEADIMNIVVHKKYRNQQIGSLLLKNLIKLSQSLNLKSISLEVSENNAPAISLYNKFYFETISIRKKYYNNSNGIVMIKKLIK